MASPPRSSPTTSPHMPLANPKKRPSLSLSHNPSKRRRGPGSITSAASSAHPLRQTSFPPDESAIDDGARSPSVESDVTGVTGARSQVTGGRGKKKRGKGKKGEPGSVKSGGVKGREESEVPEEEEEDEDDGLDDGGTKEKDADKITKKKNLAVLVDAFNTSQLDRYETFRRVKLKKETVRKIANQTLSQSVPPTVITTINGYTKTFIGTLIERAREIQAQYSAPLPLPLSLPQKPPHHHQKQIPIDPTDFHHSNPNNDIFTTTSLPGAEIVPASGLFDVVDAGDRRGKGELGPLLPEHFREALRRYRRDGEAGGTGMTGWSVGLGMPGTGSARVGGGRLLR